MRINADRTTPATHHNSIVSLSSETRLLWLRTSLNERRYYTDLLSKLCASGIPIDVVGFEAYGNFKLNDFSLIFINVDESLYTEIVPALHELRAISRTPIFLLTLSYTLEWMVAAIQAGADAVVDVTKPDEVIIAQALALIRRWPSAPLLGEALPKALSSF